MKNLYAVIQPTNIISVDGKERMLKKGCYMIPCFDNMEDAKKFCNGLAEIIELTPKK